MFGMPPAWNGFVPQDGRPVRGLGDADHQFAGGPELFMPEPFDMPPMRPAGSPGMGISPQVRVFSPDPELVPMPMPRGRPPRRMKDRLNVLRAGADSDPPGASFDPSRFVRKDDVKNPAMPQGGLDADSQLQNIPDALHRKHFPRGDFKVVRKLKEGGQSEAVNIVQASNGQLFVEKRIRRRGRSILAERELRTLAAVTNGYGSGRHLNTMVGHTTIDGGDAISLILEYCDGGSVDQLLSDSIKARRQIPEVAIWNIVYGVAAGLAFLHDGIKSIAPGKEHLKTPDWNTICHLDVKPQNIFVHKPRMVNRNGGISSLPRVVLGDFGCAVSLREIQSGEESSREQRVGTPAWYPPEGKGRTSYGTKSDMWALGLTIFCLCRMVYDPSMRNYSRENLCGRAYGRRLNGLVRALTTGDLKRRPAARDVASAALAIVMEKTQK
ncbi:hypothetical protein CERZMDRAFT_92875 [Cercospora zeae-maydis SCOH1-5]|uniref:non-specific serine/threonine protein kinase n=1 Tax=Cercospora zeae-maydis SCOH1-5 TaxID=717836 RepID=A0A6A6FTP3_9PEZI|nr:hypothetical protein CERZMDRAFT_92875 [Cercospora zeae-maydis SCOH1-5]